KVPVERLECNALAGRFPLGEGDVLLAKPQTYKNRSGYAARCFAERYELDPSALLVVYDEVSLPLGRIRPRRAGGPPGRSDVESVIETLRPIEVPRLRLGVGWSEGRPMGEDLVDFVLS